MDEKVIRFKEEFKEKLFSAGVLRRVSSIEFRCKTCPICGDMKYHLYLYININSDDAIRWNCFKCHKGGLMTQEYLDKFELGMTVPRFKGKKRLDISHSVKSVGSRTTICDTDDVSAISKYIESRVGVYPTIEDLNKFDYIVNPRKYVMDYLGDEKIRMIGNRHWFKMTNGNIVGRVPEGDDSPRRWLKYDSNRINTTGLYRINQAFYIDKRINVCIAEGVMDVIGLYYNYPIENAVYIAALGSNYKAGIQYVIDRGIYGDSVNIKIFKDADIDLSLINIPRRMRELFASIEIYENLKSKDTGVRKEEMDIHRILEISHF